MSVHHDRMAGMSERTPGAWAPINTAADLGLFLRDLRTQAGLTQAQLADELGVTRQYVVELETGKPNLYSDRLFQALRLLGGHLRAQGPGW
jgi:HTH-type transcriptional regulator / antitoxin HipB